MIGIWFLILNWWLGYVLVAGGERWLKESLTLKGFARKREQVPVELVKLAGGLLVGLMVSTWMVYLVALGMGVWWGIEEPLEWSNVVVIGGLSGVLGWWSWKREKFLIKEVVSEVKKMDWGLLMIGGLIVAIFSYLFYYTFRVEAGELLVGASVFSDFGPHLALIRSFSQGSNFPTVYPHFPAGDIRYHFMMDFLVGNLEFLGLRIDHAFNGVSILALACFLILLYSLGVVVSGKRGVGRLVLVLWMFRSSPAIWGLLEQENGWRKFLISLLSLERFIGETRHEDWGLWNQNVYLNQRHLVFGWGILLLVFLVLLPWWMKKESFIRRIIKRIIGRPERDLRRVLFAGLILGGLGFFNGAVVIAGLLVIGMMMLFSRKWIASVGVLLVVGGLVFLQKNLFVEGGVVEPKLVWGFLAEERSVEGLIVYWVELLGIWAMILPVSMVMVPRRYWGLGVGMLTPLIFANIVSLTPDIAVNHKYVMTSVMVLNIWVAYFLVRVAGKNRLGKLVAIGLIGLLVVTGIADLSAILNVNREPLRYKQEGEYFDFVRRTEKRAVFLVDGMPVSNPVLLSGRFVYFGWPYFAWSAGYDTNVREKDVREIYEMEVAENLQVQLKERGIDYLVYEKGENKNMMVAEQVLLKVFEGEGKIVFAVR